MAFASITEQSTARSEPQYIQPKAPTLLVVGLTFKDFSAKKQYLSQYKHTIFAKDFDQALAIIGDADITVTGVALHQRKGVLPEGAVDFTARLRAEKKQVPIVLVSEVATTAVDLSSLSLHQLADALVPVPSKYTSIIQALGTVYKNKVLPATTTARDKRALQVGLAA